MTNVYSDFYTLPLMLFFLYLFMLNFHTQKTNIFFFCRGFTTTKNVGGRRVFWAKIYGFSPFPCTFILFQGKEKVSSFVLRLLPKKMFILFCPLFFHHFLTLKCKFCSFGGSFCDRHYYFMDHIRSIRQDIEINSPERCFHDWGIHLYMRRSETAFTNKILCSKDDSNNPLFVIGRLVSQAFPLKKAIWIFKS